MLNFQLFEVGGLGRAASPRPPRRKAKNLNFGRADGPHRPIERFRFESLNRRITDDPPYQWAVARVMGEVISNTGVLLKAVNTAKEKE